MAAAVVAGVVGSAAPVAAVDGDTEPPAVWIVSPYNGVRVRGIVNVKAAVHDNVAVTRVDVYAGGVLAGSASAAPWTVAVNTAGRNARVPLVAKAFDAAGNSATATVTVTADNLGPGVPYSAPHANVPLTGFVNTGIQPVDPSGIAVADLYVAGQFVARRTRSPWTAYIYMAGRSGPVLLRWHVTDKLGNQTVATRTVIADNVAPKVRVARSPRHRAQVRGTVRVEAGAYDRHGIRFVELVVNRVVVARDTKAPYTFRLNTTRYNGRFTWRVRAVDNAGIVTGGREYTAYAAKRRR